MTSIAIHPILDPIRDLYLQKQHALGRQYHNEEWTINALSQFLAKVGASDLNQSYFEQWCQTQAGLNANTRRARQQAVRNFCLYRQRTEPDCFVPDINRFPRPCPYLNPIIVSAADVARMLAAAKDLPPGTNSPLRADVMRIAVVLLYTAGLRRGELLRLTLADVDTRKGILCIRESKFHKSRFVPLSHDALIELRLYLKRRLARPYSTSPSSPLLANCSGGFRGYTGTGLSYGIQLLFQIAEVCSTDGRRPRIHDMRHSFAIAVLLRWYQQGADVQSNLPKLAMYMGHVSIVSTAYYLKWIPEVAEFASQRFEAQFGYLITGDAQ